jgi:hypothetical protein
MQIIQNLRNHRCTACTKCRGSQFCRPRKAVLSIIFCGYEAYVDRSFFWWEWSMRPPWTAWSSLSALIGYVHEAGLSTFLSDLSGRSVHLIVHGHAHVQTDEVKFCACTCAHMHKTDVRITPNKWHACCFIDDREKVPFWTLRGTMGAWNPVETKAMWTNNCTNAKAALPIHPLTAGPCSQNLVRQPITARWGVIPWDLCTVPAKISRKSNRRPMNFIPFKVFSMRVFVNAIVSPFLNWKTIVRFSFVLHDSVDPFLTRTACQYFWAEWMDLPPKRIYHLGAGQVSQSFWWHRFVELQTIQSNWIMVRRVRWKRIRCRMIEPPGFSNRQLRSTIGLDTFHSESRVMC